MTVRVSGAPNEDPTVQGTYSRQQLHRLEAHLP